jgi:glycosyltransferase involved in cell wall biosynthesis
MKILFVTAAPGLPQMIGGSQHTADTLIRNLNARGHEAQLFCGLSSKGRVGFVARAKIKLSFKKFATDHALGYPASRAWHPWEVMDQAVAEVAPDVVVVLAHYAGWMAKAVARTGKPFVMAFQDVEFGGEERDLTGVPIVPSVANSAFTASRYREKFGFDPIVIHPIIDPQKYKTQPSRTYVTFINPHPEKGLEIAIALAAACPDLPFLFVEGWPLDPAARVALLARLRDVPNVRLHPSVSDMRRVYSQTNVLLAPSQWEEGYGRVATEAQFSGTPVLGTNRGGLPEAIGPGGIILDKDAPVEEWTKSLREMWNGEQREELGRMAQRHAARPELDNRKQIDRWIEYIERAPFAAG